MPEPTFIDVWGDMTKADKRRCARFMNVSVAALALHRITSVIDVMKPGVGVGCDCASCKLYDRLRGLQTKKEG